MQIQILDYYHVPGFLPGVGQASIVVELKIAPDSISEQVLETCDRIMDRMLANHTKSRLPADLAKLSPVNRIADYSLRIFEFAGLPVYGQARLVYRDQNASDTVSLAIPSTDNTGLAAWDTVVWVSGLVTLISQDRDIRGHRKKLQQLVEKMRVLAPRGTNTRYFLDAAALSDIPFQRLHANIFRFGWGSRARLLDSAVTDETPKIAAGIAQRKHVTTDLLRNAGIPVPQHVAVGSAQDAVRLAEQLGYPVVLKPIASDGGKGVFARLKNADAVAKAYESIKHLGRYALLEKYIVGNDYRFQVYKDEVFRVIQRVPGGVTGDGVNTVKYLLERYNADPRRGHASDPNASRKRVELDDEAFELLAEQQFTLESIPAEGRFVRLRNTANIATGGTPVPVLDITHPDNLALAVRAVRVVGLDLGGVDLIMEDISRSWLETGAAVLEVNAKPQLGPGHQAYVLKRLVEGNGRIPVIFMLAAFERVARLLDQMQDALSSAGMSLGIARSEGVWIEGRQIAVAGCDAYTGGQALLTDPSVDVAILVFDQPESISNGLPVDRLDALAVLSSSQPQQRMLDSLANMCAGKIMADQADGLVIDGNSDRVEAMTENGMKGELLKLCNCSPL